MSKATTTGDFNLANWSGKSASVNFSAEGEFSFYGYQFKLGEFESTFRDSGFRVLYQIESGKRIRAGMIMSHQSMTLREDIVSAVRFVANRY